MLFDCGNNDKIITDPDYWGPFVKALDPGRTPDIAIDAQLGKINVKPSDIKYVVLGHFHVDHAGNVGKFLGFDVRLSARRDQERVLAGAGLRDVLYHRGFRHAAQQHRRRHAKQGTRPSSSMATSTCSATTASKSTAPCRTRPAAR